MCIQFYIHIFYLDFFEVNWVYTIHITIEIWKIYTYYGINIFGLCCHGALVLVVIIEYHLSVLLSYNRYINKVFGLCHFSYNLFKYWVVRTFPCYGGWTVWLRTLWLQRPWDLWPTGISFVVFSSKLHYKKLFEVTKIYIKI